MRHFTSATQLANAHLQDMARMRYNVKRMIESIGDAAEKDMYELTSGRISTRQLTALGHPYARTGRSVKNSAGRMRGASKVGIQTVSKIIGTVAVPRLPINRQSGRLRSSIYRRQVESDDVYKVTVGFNPTIAGSSLYVVQRGGTRRMIDRRFWEEIERRWKARATATLVYLRDVR